MKHATIIWISWNKTRDTVTRLFVLASFLPELTSRGAESVDEVFLDACCRASDTEAVDPAAAQSSPVLHCFLKQTERERERECV